MAYYGLQSATGDRPDRPLVVKCSFDRSLRRITFASAKNCNYMLLRARVEQCFALSASSFTMSYQDDDGETTDILNEHDLTEAIQYFHAGPDENASANGSIMSGYSGRVSRKITLRLRVAVEYDGPSLSDTGSLVSLEDYPKHRNGGSIHLSDSESYRSSAFPPEEPDDDAITISSHDTASRSGAPHQGIGMGARYNQRDFANRFSESLSIEEEADGEISLSESAISLGETYPEQEQSGASGSVPYETDPTSDPTSLAPPDHPASRKHSSSTMSGRPEPAPGQVFERLRQLDADPRAASQQSLPLDANERGVRWLKDQTDRAVWHSIGTPMASSSSLRPLASNMPQEPVAESDFDAASSSFQSGDLELQKDDRGKYYYTFTADSSSHIGSERPRSPFVGDASVSSISQPPPPIDDFRPIETQSFGAGPSSGLAKRVSQVSHITESQESSAPISSRSRGSRLGKVVESGEISPELLQAILESESQSGPDLVTDCSSCGDILDSFRYVCTTCGEKHPQSRDSLAIARSLTTEPAAVDPFDDVNEVATANNDWGLRLQTSSSVGEPSFPSHPRDEEDIADARSEASFSTSSWTQVRDHSHVANQRSASDQPHSSSSWGGLLPGRLASLDGSSSGSSRQDSRPTNEYPLATFKSKLKRGFKRGIGSGPSSTNGKGKALPSIPDDEASAAGGRPGPTPHQHQHVTFYETRPQQLSPYQQQQQHPRRPEVVITERVTSHSGSSSGSRSNSNSASTPTAVALEAGYELCSKCIAVAGVVHAESALSAFTSTTPTPTATNSFSLGSLGSSPHDGQHSPSNTFYSSSGSGVGAPDWVSASGISPTAIPPPVPKKTKRKVQIRHAYVEKFWGVGGWQDVELDDDSTCSICNKQLDKERYKCISCEQFNLCRAHYSQVHEIHPSHAFVAVPDKEAAIPAQALITIPDEEQSMTHPGVRCDHCLQDIVGARFHCAQCDDVDICANCESAGLPGNLTSPDGGHDSSHIMIKIPLPIESAEVRQASERARALLSGRDAPALGARGPRPRANSFESSYQQTVVGLPRKGIKKASMEHHILCRACNRSIVGLRYQCASCPSLPSSYSLCDDCERISFTVHDPMHIFIKITSPVDRPIESPHPLMPPIYDIPSGQDRDGNRYGEDFKEYLQSVKHNSAICDRCIEPIHGEWFRCANCDADLCEDCEQMGIHDPAHVFLVFKSTIDMQKFRRAADLDNDHRKVGVLQHLVHAT